MRDTADLLDKIKGSIVTTYEAKTSLSADEISAMMTAETWFNAAEAVEKGFATRTSSGGQTVSNLSKPWIQNAPKPAQIAEDIQTQTAWRLAVNRRRFSLIDKK
jgi:ATP-dependent Clp protease protease subunit